MLRSIETWMRAGAMPRSISASAVKRIMISGPQTSATAEAGSKRAPATSLGTTPTLPRQPRAAASTVTSSWTLPRCSSASSSRR